MSKVLVIGAAGMAGHIIYTYLKETDRHDILGTIHKNTFSGANYVLNIQNTRQLNDLFSKFKPQIVINCVGILIKGSQDNPANAIYTNAYFPHVLSDLCDKNNSKLIHISTDCVFSGAKGNYTETSSKDAQDLYGQSKALGEIIDNHNLTIRTSIIGPELKSPGEGLFDWFMRERGSVNGFSKALWSGVTTLELARFIEWSFTQNISGLVHLTNNDPISKFDLLKIFSKLFKRAQVNLVEGYVVDKSFVNTRADFHYRVPTYSQMLEEQRKFMLAHGEFYSHYFIDDI